MYSLETIKSMNRKATREAKKEGLQVYVANINGDSGVRACKQLGDYIPEGWKLVNTYFVDNSGFGSADELALTFEQFLSKVKAGYGYGIGESGEFQVYINEYKRI